MILAWKDENLSEILIDLKTVSCEQIFLRTQAWKIDLKNQVVGRNVRLYGPSNCKWVNDCVYECVHVF